MAKDAEVDYDFDDDVLSVSMGRKVKDSLPIDRYVVDFDKSDKIVGIELFDASKVLSNLLQKNISKEELREIQKARMKVFYSKEMAYILISLFVNRKPIVQNVPLPTPIAVTAYA